jgi:hypothetical protein
MSLKYQVLCKDTAMIAVIKNAKTQEALSSTEVKVVKISCEEMLKSKHRSDLNFLAAT